LDFDEVDVPSAGPGKEGRFTSLAEEKGDKKGRNKRLRGGSLSKRPNPPVKQPTKLVLTRRRHFAYVQIPIPPFSVLSA